MNSCCFLSLFDRQHMKSPPHTSIKTIPPPHAIMIIYFSSRGPSSEGFVVILDVFRLPDELLFETIPPVGSKRFKKDYFKF